MPENESTALSRLMPAIEGFADARVLCVGDVMLDRFVYGEVSRISPEAPIPVMKRTRDEVMPGGAGNVMRNIVSLGAQCGFISVIGDDDTGRRLIALAGQQERLEPYLITDKTRRSSEKTRFVCGNQQLLRCDDEQPEPLNEASEAKLLSLLKQTLPDYRLLALSDYAKGVLTDRVLREAVALAEQHGVPVFIDPKRADWSAYAGADLLSPNLAELRLACPGEALKTDEAITEAARGLCSRYELAQLLVTRGQDGMSLIPAQGDVQHVAAHAREVFDVSGAGDTVMATLAVAHASGLALPEAAALANLAAAIVVGRRGTACIYRTDLKAALHQLDVTTSHAKIVPVGLADTMIAGWRAGGESIGFTNGCFDVLHVGHLHALQDARRHCDRLVVAINSDASVRRLKGEDRPLNGEMDRAALLAGLGCVDLVVIFREDTPEALIKRFRPDVLMKGADYRRDEVIGGAFVESYGGRIELLPLHEGYSTSALLEKARKPA